MSERRFVLLDFTHMSRVGFLQLYEAGRLYALPRDIAHAASKRELVAREQPAHWVRPSMFRAPESHRRVPRLTKLCCPKNWLDSKRDRSKNCKNGSFLNEK
jgi:hypothetical protein